MTVILFRCQNGIVAWQRARDAAHLVVWVCMRDNASLELSLGVEPLLLAMAQHSSSLAGAILQVVELGLQ